MKINTPHLKYIFKTLCALIAILFYLNAYPQSTDSIRITESFKDQQLINILTQLESKYPIRFYYKLEWLSEDPVSFNFFNSTIQEMTEIITKNLNMDFYIRQNNIVLMPERDIVRLYSEINGFQNTLGSIDYNNLAIIGSHKDYQKNKKTYLTGKVMNGATGDALLGATIVVNNTDLYSISDINGNYSIELKPGIYTITISSVGFESSENSIELVSSGTFDIELFEKSLKLKEVKVYAQKADRNVSGNQMSIIQLDSKNIKQLPSITGEKDLMKSFTMMPGVQSVGEFGSGINVRGGGEDQNLFLMEGAPIFNTSHLMGLMSVVNADAVTNVTLYKGHIPTEFGERVASVMDIQLNDYNIDKFTCTGGLGIYNSRLTIEGPLFNKKVIYKIGGRTSYSDMLLHKIPDYNLMNSSAKFYDLNGLVTFNFKKDHITLFGYYSNDYFDYAHNYIYNYGNSLGSVSWVHRFNEAFSTSFNTSYSNYGISSEDRNDSSNYYQIKSSISYLSSKLKCSFTGINKHKIDVGLQAIKYNIEPGSKTNITKINKSSLNKSSESGAEFSFFITDAYDISDNISIQAGLRYSKYLYLGPKVILNYSEGLPLNVTNISDSTTYGKGKVIKSYQGFEPRISVKFKFFENCAIKLSYNRNNQYLSLLSYYSISSPEDVWKLSDPYIKPLISDQFAIGYYQNFLVNTIETSVELYYKKLQNLVEYKNDAKLSINEYDAIKDKPVDLMMMDHVESQLIEAEGTNYGIEFLIKRTSKKIDGWISYTYSRSFRQTAGRNQEEQVKRNEIYPSQYDKPHDLNIAFNYHLNRRLRFGFNFTLISGRSVALPEYIYKIENYTVPQYSDRGKYRLPPYHRLDISISCDESLKKKKFWKGSWTFSVLNLYGRDNAYSVFFKKEKPTEYNGYKMYSSYKLYLIGIPMPTLTYNFKF